ncbi:hypothetical protein MRB53_041379 [Persea americana]|nr:hypothetical protein MRB53_041379 [Persea americana]
MSMPSKSEDLSGTSCNAAALGLFGAAAKFDVVLSVPHFFVVAFGRLLPATTPVEVQELIAGFPRTACTYDNFLSSPYKSGPLEEGYRPEAVMRLGIVALADGDAKPMPSTLSPGLANPFLVNFLREFFDPTVGMMRPQDPLNPHILPTEIHFLTNGMEGGALGLHDTRNGTDIADRIFLVPHVVPEDLPASPIPGQPNRTSYHSAVSASFSDRCHVSSGRPR